MPKEEKKLEDYDMLLEEEHQKNGMIKILAAIFLTAAALSGIGYYTHIYTVDNRANDIESRIVKLESRVISELRKKDKLINKNEKDEFELKISELEENNQNLEQQIEELKNQISTSTESEATSTPENLEISDTENLEASE